MTDTKDAYNKNCVLCLDCGEIDCITCFCSGVCGPHCKYYVKNGAI